MIQLGSAYGEIQIGTGQAEQNITSLSSTLRSVGSTMSLAISAPLIGAATVALKSAGDFEQSMNIMQQVSGATEEQMASLQAQALQLGADTSFSAGEAAEGMLELTKAGMDAKEVGQSIGGVMALAAAGNMSLAQAAEITANAVNAFNLPASEAGRVADLLAAAANSSSVEVSDMGQSFQMVSAAAAALGISIDDVSTSLAILGNNGIKGSDAGTSLKTMFERLTAPTKEAKKLMDELGISVFDSSGNMRAYPDILADLQQAMYGMNETTVVTSGRTKEQTAQMEHYADVIKRTKQKLADYAAGVAGVRQSEAKKAQTIDQLNRELVAAQAAYGQLAGIQGTATTVMRQLTEAERAEYMQTIFGTDGKRAANILLKEGIDGYNEMKGAVTEQGAAADVANARMKGFNGAIEYLKGSIDSFLIGTALPFLDSFGGIVRMVADAITGFGGLSQPVKDAALAFAAVLAVAGPLMVGLSYMGTVLAALTSPIGLTVLALAGLAAAFAADAFGVRTLVANLGNYITMVLDAGANSIEAAEALGLLPPALQGAAQWTGQAVDGLVNYTASVIDAGFGSTEAQESISLFPASLQSAVAWFDATADGLINYVASVRDAGFGSTEAQESISLFPASLQGVISWVDTTIPKLAALYTWFAAQIPSALAAAQAFIQPAITTMVAWFQGALPTALTVLQSVFAAAWSTIPSLITGAWGVIQPVLSLLASWLLSVLPASGAQLQASWAGIWNSISTITATAVAAVTAIWNGLVAIFGPSIENLKTAFGEMIAGFSTMGPEFQALWAAVQPVIEQLKMGVMILAASWGAQIGGIILVAINALAAAFRNLPALVSVAVAQMIAIFNFISTTVSSTVALVQAIIAGDWAAAWSSATAIVSGLVTFIQSSLANWLVYVGVLIQTVGDTIAGVLSGLGFDKAAASVQAFVGKIVGLIGWISQLAKGEIAVDLAAPAWIDSLLAWAWPVIGKAVDWVTTLVAWAWPAMAATAVAWLQTLMSWDWPDFVSQPSWVSDLVEWAWPDFISAPAWLSDLLNWDWPTLPTLPSWLGGGGEGNAGGTSYGYGQLSGLNERGRELISIPSDQGILPPGSRVYTNGQSNRMLAGAGGGGDVHVHLDGLVIQNDRDIHSTVNEIGRLLRRQLG